MKVLWITNDLLPEAKSILSKCNSKIDGTGSWIYALYEAFSSYARNINVRVASVSRLVKKLTILQGQSITYYVIPYERGNCGVYSSEYEKYWLKINDDFCPDIVHIHGSEYTHGLAYVRACGSANVVVSIQGLVSVYSEYMYGGIDKKIFKRCITLHDIITSYSIGKQTAAMERRGCYEVELLSSVNHIIGRTHWDKAHSFIINPRSIYHYNGENLREEFYNGTWSYSNCTPYTIFMSQGQYAYKGLHILLKALSIVQMYYPTVKLTIAGPNILKGGVVKSMIISTCYGLYISKLIKKLSLGDVVEFVGPLDATQMKEKLLSSNLYVLPSCIENSPNSLGEAQLLGVPCVAANVGGVIDMVPDSDCGTTYRYDDYKLLAYHICQLFEYSKTYNNEHQRKVASDRHNRENNVIQLLKIYEQIRDSIN